MRTRNAFTSRTRRAIAASLCLLAPATWAQQPDIHSQRAPGNRIIGDYKPVTVPDVRLGNSERLRALLRGGNLYLTAQDAVLLALENSIDIEVSRYNPEILDWQLMRSQAGGALAGVPSQSSAASSVTSGQGVLGAQSAAGVSSSSSSSSRGSGNATVSQVGPVVQVLDPVVQESTFLSHRTVLLNNVTQSTRPVLIQSQRTDSASIQEGYLAGGSVTLTFKDQYLNENATTDILNPSTASSLSISVSQNLLQGFGVALNNRNIRIAKLNRDMSDLNFRNTVEQIVVATLNTYYELVGDYESIAAQTEVLAAAERFSAETSRRLELGAVARLDVTTAENQVAQAKQALIASQAALKQDEVTIKNRISRTGLADPLIAEARIVPLDRITITASDDLPPVSELVSRAKAHRADLLVEEQNLKSSQISSLGTKNGLLPTVQAFGTRTTSGLGGTQKVVNGTTADPYFKGGAGTAFDQVVRQNFPTESIGAGGRVTVYNRQAQADFGIDQLQLRQQELQLAKDRNQSQVDVMNAVVALRQARSRYEAAVQNRILEQQLLDAEQKKFAVGESTSYNVIVQQRDLATARATEISTLVAWRSARINLDQTTGSTLEASHIALDGVKAGRMPETSALPASLPDAPR